jgi:Glycoside hydrolase family 44
MAFYPEAGRNGLAGQTQIREGQPAHSTAAQTWKDLSTQRSPKPRRHGRALTFVSILLLIMLIFTAVRVSTVASGADDILQVQVGNQQTAQVDLRQSFPISPYLIGANVFPETRTSSLDQPFSGFMPYTSLISSDMQAMHMQLLRFPGGDWGEDHMLSLDQMSKFSQLLINTHAQGMMQAHLSGPVPNQIGDPQPHDVTADVSTRANLAGRWVDYMNNPKSNQRMGAHANDPFHRVAFWTVGNEPDLLINPVTQKTYTVAEYVDAFIQFSLDMHQNDPTIKVFGPELSQFTGVGSGPMDAHGHLWMDDFLKGVSDYEKSHPTLPYHLLDGVSFHSYQFEDASQSPSMLLSSPDEWNYLLPPLRTLIQRDFGRDIPIAITEINTNPKNLVPSPALASLWWADTLGALMNQQAEYVAFFSAAGVDEPYPLFTQDGLHETAMERVMELFAHLQSNLVPLNIQHDPISVYATQDKGSQNVSLLFVNKSATTQLAQITPQNEILSVSPWHNLNISIAAYSMVVVTLTHNGGATAYSFIAPTSTDAPLPPLTYTVCGHKTDALENSIPC